MPELPEVETIRRGLARLIIGQTIASVTSDTPKSFPNDSQEVAQFFVRASIVAVRRRAKVLLIDLSSGYTLVTHLKMTGQLVFVSGGNQQTKRHGLPSSESTVRWGGGHPSDSLVHALPDKTTRVEIAFERQSSTGSDPEMGGRLYFNDMRKFGWMKLYPTVEVPHIDFMKRVGPEPLEDDFTPEVLYERLQRRKNTSIKAALLDQTVLAGIGNIYADESLWGAQIHPATLVRDIPHASFPILCREIKYVLNLSIDKGGSTDKNYVDAEGKRGSYLTFARVFRREGQACPRCNTTIEKIRVAGRGTHICPMCQK